MTKHNSPLPEKSDENSDVSTEDLQQALIKNWGLPENTGITREQLEQLLAERIAELINSDWEGLLRILYRIDVDERIFHQALEAPTVAEQARELASAMIDREIRKIFFRKKFSTGGA